MWEELRGCSIQNSRLLLIKHTGLFCWEPRRQKYQLTISSEGCIDEVRDRDKYTAKGNKSQVCVLHSGTELYIFFSF